jgi:hypothetical protein
MFAGQDRNQLRHMFFEVWRKQHALLPMEPLEKLIAEIIRQHPEYHEVLQNEEASLDRDYLPEVGQTNPFLHMSMHIAIHEQLASQRPAGIVEIFRTLTSRLDDSHEAEHRMMECLAQMLWQAQRDNTLPDEGDYMENLRRLVP